MMDEAEGTLTRRVCSDCNARCRGAAPKRAWGTLPPSSGPTRAEASKLQDMSEHETVYAGRPTPPGQSPQALSNKHSRVSCKMQFPWAWVLSLGDDTVPSPSPRPPIWLWPCTQRMAGVRGNVQPHTAVSRAPASKPSRESRTTSKAGRGQALPGSVHSWPTSSAASVRKAPWGSSPSGCPERWALGARVSQAGAGPAHSAGGGVPRPRCSKLAVDPVKPLPPAQAPH